MIGFAWVAEVEAGADGIFDIDAIALSDAKDDSRELGKIIEVDNNYFLTPQQEKMMATQPDMMLQYAHILKEHYENAGFKNPEIYADTYVSLNGRIGKALIDPTVDLSKEKESFRPKHWILPFQDEIKGL